MLNLKFELKLEFFFFNFFSSESFSIKSFSYFFLYHFIDGVSRSTNSAFYKSFKNPILTPCKSEMFKRVKFYQKRLSIEKYSSAATEKFVTTVILQTR